MAVPYRTSAALAAVPGIRHGFFGRTGGVSTGDFAGNNVSFSVGDDPGEFRLTGAGSAQKVGFVRPARLGGFAAIGAFDQAVQRRNIVRRGGTEGRFAHWTPSSRIR